MGILENFVTHFDQCVFSEPDIDAKIVWSFIAPLLFA